MGGTVKARFTRNPRVLRTLLALSTFLAALASHWPLRTLDFDPHHDGYVVAVATAVSEGRIPHSGVFAQYGPVVALLQGLVLRLGEPPVLTLRTLNVALIALCAALLSLAGGTRSDGPWSIPPVAGPIVAAVWIVLSDTFTWVPMLPWVALLVTAQLLGAVVLSRIGVESSSSTVRAICQATAGALVAFTTLSRPAVGVIGLGLLVGLNLLHPSFRREFRLLVLSAVATSLVLAVSVAASDWGPDFLRQVFIWPVERYLLGGTSQSSIGLLLRTGLRLTPQILCVYLLLPYGPRSVGVPRRDTALALVALGSVPGIEEPERRLVVVIAVAAATLLSFRTSEGDGSSRSSRAASGLLASVILVGVPALSQEKVGWHATTHVDAGAVVKHFINVANHALYLALIVGAALAAAAVLRFIGSRNVVNSSPQMALVAAIALASVGEVASVADTRHIWWSLPLPLLVAVTALVPERADPSTRVRVMAAAIGLAILAVPAAYSAFLYHGQDRVALEGGIAAGLRSPQEDADRYHEQLDGVRVLLAQDDTGFIVSDAHIVVMDGRVLTTSPNLVWWGPDAALSEVLRRRTIVVQEQYLDGDLRLLLRDEGFYASDLIPGFVTFVR